MSNLPVHDRILSTARDLFYRQGYRATGINQVIAESGVAKASFYDHFPSKDDLLVEYLRETGRSELADVRQGAMAHGTARERFLGPINLIEPWFEATDYRGCPFQNAVAETPPDNPAVQQILRQYRDNMRALLTELAWDLQREEPKLSRLDVPSLVDTYLLLMEGAIAVAVAYRQPWPIHRAIAAIEAMIATP